MAGPMCLHRPAQPRGQESETHEFLSVPQNNCHRTGRKGCLLTISTSVTPEGIDAVLGRQITRGASLGSGLSPPGTPGKEGEDSRAPVNRKHVSLTLRSGIGSCVDLHDTRWAAATLPSKPRTLLVSWD